MKMKSFLAISSLIAVSGIACAGAQKSSISSSPKVPTAAPYIVLSNNLDEPNGYGFCMDTYGPGQSDLMQTHSCKPHKEGQSRDYSGFDTRFFYNSKTEQVASYAFDGMCMQALIASGLNVFALLECSDHARQKFIYDDSDRTLRLAEDKEQCVSVASETVPAGPWVKRPLTLQECEKVDASLKQWNVVSE